MERSRCVATVADCWMAAGHHALAWSTRGVASGVYFIRLQSPDGVLARKVHVVL